MSNEINGEDGMERTARKMRGLGGGGKVRRVRHARMWLAFALSVSLFSLTGALTGGAAADDGGVDGRASTEAPSVEADPAEQPAGSPAEVEPSEEPAPADEAPSVEDPAGEGPAVQAPDQDSSPADEAGTAPVDPSTEPPTRDAGAGAEEDVVVQQQPSQGFIQVEGEDIDDTPQNAPHEGCIWTVEFRNFASELGGETATVTLTLVPPTSLPGQTFSISESTTLGGTDAPGPELDAVIVMDISSLLQEFIDAGGEEHPQGFHVRLDAVVAGEIEKHHVFWNQGCPVTQPEPGLNVTKTCPPTGEVGETITYEITLFNNGEEDLNIISVEDTLLGDLTSSFPSVLEVGETVTEEFPYEIMPDDPDPLENVVTVMAEGVESEDEVTEVDECVTDIPPEAGLDVAKSCPSEAEVGEAITYEITITNTGEEELDIVSVVDTLLGDLTAEFPDILDPGESVTEQFQREVVTGDPDPLENVVTVEGAGLETGADFTVTAECLTDIVTPPTPPPPTPPTPPTPPVPTPPGPPLAVTGANILLLAAAAGSLLLAGGGLLGAGRRRRHQA